MEKKSFHLTRKVSGIFNQRFWQNGSVLGFTELCFHLTTMLFADTAEESIG